MEADQIHVLCTGALEPVLVEKAYKMGISIQVIPFITVRSSIDNTMGAKIKKLTERRILSVFTSMQALKAIQPLIGSECPWKVACLEGKTSEVATGLFGYANIEVTGENAMDLAYKIVELKSKDPIHFFCGSLRLETLPEILRESGINLVEWVVYETLTKTQKLVPEYDGIMFMSPAAVDSFAAENDIVQFSPIFAIGQTTKQHLEKYISTPVITGRQASREALTDAVIEYFIE